LKISTDSEKNKEFQAIQKKDKFFAVCIYTLVILTAAAMMLMLFNILIRLK